MVTGSHHLQKTIAHLQAKYLGVILIQQMDGENFDLKSERFQKQKNRVEFLRDGEPISWREFIEFVPQINELIAKGDDKALNALLSEQNLEIKIKNS